MPYSNTLLADLMEWDRLEQTLRSAFKDRSMSEKDILKLRLSEYERLYRVHGNLASTRDDLAMLQMIRYQRPKLERILYPGLASRLLRRAVLALRNQLFQSAAAPPVSVTHGYSTSKQSAFSDHLQGGIDQESEPKRRYGHDWGRRQSRDQGKGMGI